MRTDHGPGLSGPGGSLRRFRVVAALAIGIAIGVAMMATPVSGHVGNSVTHLWNAHLKSKTDARYYTKAQANSRYLLASGTAADAEQLDGLDSTAFLPATGKAADADELDGLDSTAFLPATGKAADADELDGLDSTAFLRSNGKAADAELLDGLDSTQFVQGNGQTAGEAVLLAPGTGDGVFGIGGVFNLSYLCPAGVTGPGQLFIFNSSASAVNLFLDSGGDNPTVLLVPGSTAQSTAAAASGDSFHIQVQGTFGVATIEVATVHRASGCLVTAQAVLTT